MEQTDRELLELAAKAAGIDNLGWMELSSGIATMSAKHGIWNPLTDDGDALRLAVKLPHLNLQWVIASAWQAEETHEGRMDYVRRAIVRAAAEIGKGMQ